MRNSRSQRGMSLIEATVILAVLSILTAVVAPAVRLYAQNAQQAAAKEDVETIGTAVAAMLTDVGEAWFVKSGAKSSGTTSHLAPVHTSTERIDLLVSSGNTPSVYSGVARGAGTDWNSAVGTGAIQKLEYYLVLNTPGLDAAKAYRTGTAMSGVDNFDPNDGQTFNSEYAWRGPYLPGPV